MKKALIKSLTTAIAPGTGLNSGSQETYNNFWDLPWYNFFKVISKAITACETAGNEVSDHFTDVGKMVSIGSGTEL